MSDDIPKIAEKRNYKRIDAELPVQLELNGKKIETTTENISCGGMFIPQVGQKLLEDEAITAVITLPQDSKIIKMPGRVCRVLTDPNSKAYGVAIQFSGLYDDNSLEIDRYVKWKLLN